MKISFEGFIMFFLSISIFYLFYFTVKDNVQFYKYGIKTSAIVKDVEYKYAASKNSKYVSTIEFKANNKIYRVELEKEYKGKINNIVEIIYFENHPERAVLNNFWYMWDTLDRGFFTSFFLSSLAFLLLSICLFQFLIYIKELIFDR